MNYRKVEGNSRGLTWGSFSTFSYGGTDENHNKPQRVSTLYTEIWTEDSGMRNSNNSTVFMNYAPSILSDYHPPPQKKSAMRLWTQQWIIMYKHPKWSEIFFVACYITPNTRT